MSEGVENPVSGTTIVDGRVTRTCMIVNRKGLHARATAKFVHCVESYDAEVGVTRGEETVGGLSIMGILTLGAAQGTTVTLSAVGPQAREAIDGLAALIADRFGEDE